MLIMKTKYVCHGLTGSNIIQSAGTEILLMKIAGEGKRKKSLKRFAY